MIAGQFSRGSEQEFYYETIPLLILVGKRLGQSPSRKNRSSTKCKALFSFDRVFFVFVFTSIGTEKGRIFIRGAPFEGGATAVWGGSCPNCSPLDPPLLRPSIMKFAAVHMLFKINDLAAVLAYIEAKQTQGKQDQSRESLLATMLCKLFF